MSKPTDADDVAVAMFKEMVEKHKLTAVAIQRGVLLYHTVSALLAKGNGSLTDPALVVEIEKEIIVALAKEIDRNFYEGMLDTATKTMMSVMKIPQVKEMQKEAMADVTSKLAEPGSPAADKLKQILNKFGFGDVEPPKEKNAVESALDGLGISTRTKKESLN